MKIYKQIIKGGNQQFADKISNFDSRQTNKTWKPESKLLASVKSLISEGKIEKAIEVLIEVDKCNEFIDDLLLIKSKWSLLMRSKDLSLENSENISISESKLILAILNILKKLKTVHNRVAKNKY